MSQKRDEIPAKKRPAMHEIAPLFFFKFFGTALPSFQRSLALSKLNFAALIEIRWLGLGLWKMLEYHFTLRSSCSTKTCENINEKGENVDCWHFFIFPQYI